ncbi:MAG: hypothetical protein CFH19_00163 [Alphaproteobacteria bacterium MarineAlpha5_Bin9]|nr:MAG: hypothetical protein CFH19_00163 [Alphaproteobacteria bacterium MarineAlpha5_Bin9]|tara:strand:- start:39173 stop:39496 length:324 start_codon:yes stop_codon:yes gene_type:complete
MNTFDERKKGFEAKYINDQESEFKIRAKRNKLIGLWAAEIIKPSNVDEYVKQVRLSDLEEPGDEDIIKKLLDDFENSSQKISRNVIEEKLIELENLASEEFFNKKNN